MKFHVKEKQPPLSQERNCRKFSKTALFLAPKPRVSWDRKEKESVHDLNTYLTAIELNSLQFFVTNKTATLIL